MKSKNLLPVFIFIISISISYGCVGMSTQSPADKTTRLTEKQEKLIEEGWYIPQTNLSGELPSEYGVKPKYGQHDNYFDIEIGNGYDVAIKIVEATTDKCIRYVLVPENSSVNIQMIPQGLYYLKLAYGKDWMEQHTDSIVLGKFTKSVFYERSTNIYDFGKKNSQSIVNYRLEINIVNGEAENNFYTEQISEEEFGKN